MRILEVLDRLFAPTANRLDQMSEMMHVTGAMKGLETSQIGEAQLRTAIFMCSGCRSEEVCKTWPRKR